LSGCPRSDPAGAAPPPTAGPSASEERVVILDAEDRPVREGRLALLTRDAFDAQHHLRPDALTGSPDRLRVVVNDPSPDAPESVTLAARPGGASIVLPLTGSSPRRATPPFLLLGDPEDAAASTGVLAAAPGSRVDVRYREGASSELKVGPSVIHEIPVRVIAVGTGLPEAAAFEKAVDLRFRQANAVWEPFGRRFVRGPVTRIDAFRGLVLIRGRAAGVDDRGRPSHSGLRVDGRDLLIPCPWREDGAPLTPKAVARSLIEKAGAVFRIELLDGLAGDRDAVLLMWKRPDGTPAAVEALAASNDLSQAVTPLPVGPTDGLEVAPSGSGLSLDEAALLATGKKEPAPGLDLFVVTGLRSLGTKPAFKIYPEGQVPSPIAASAVASWSILDGSGRYPYALARVLGELLLPASLRPGPEDTLFADPLSETAGIDAHKRISAATAARIAQRGRGVPGKK
jgi:hypothetical protein